MSGIIDRANTFLSAFDGITLYDGHPAVIVRELADRIEALERERDEARALNNKYAWERDKARQERDSAERRSEAFWKEQVSSASSELSSVAAAIGSVRWMDPPDGGEVSLAEQVRRMRVDLETAEAARSVLEEQKP